MASAIAMIMGLVELVVIALVLFWPHQVLHRRNRREGLMATVADDARPPGAGWSAKPGRWLVWGAVVFFFLNLLGVVGSVLVNSFGTHWFDTWLPAGFTTQLVRRGLAAVRAVRRHHRHAARCPGWSWSSRC